MFHLALWRLTFKNQQVHDQKIKAWAIAHLVEKGPILPVTLLTKGGWHHLPLLTVLMSPLEMLV